MKSILFLVISLFAISAHAELFKWKDADGNIIFSDQPPSELDKIEGEVKQKVLPRINTVPGLEVNKSTAISSSQPEDKKAVYESLAIVSPLHDSEVRENSGKVSINVQIEPKIFVDLGHQLVIYMDDVEVSKGENTSILLDNVDRGTHEIKASIINNQGFVLRETRVTTFTLHRFSI
ncbi:MAG: DUF4124 domain-containing protein [Gammaproteobacteria bacterium]